ncbi:hypothetical protein BKA81DRAFT_233102 [Phyllosticta paracitricarpa]
MHPSAPLPPPCHVMRECSSSPTVTPCSPSQPLGSLMNMNAVGPNPRLLIVCSLHVPPSFDRLSISTPSPVPWSQRCLCRQSLPRDRQVQYRHPTRHTLSLSSGFQTTWHPSVTHDSAMHPTHTRTRGASSSSKNSSRRVLYEASFAGALFLPDHLGPSGWLVGATTFSIPHPIDSIFFLSKGQFSMSRDASWSRFSSALDILRCVLCAFTALSPVTPWLFLVNLDGASAEIDSACSSSPPLSASARRRFATILWTYRTPTQY